MKKQIAEIFLAAFLLGLAIFISFIPTIYYVSKASATSVFPFIHNSLIDYYFYLSLMHQGFEGNWLATTRFTPEHFPPQFIQTFLLLLGHLSRITSIGLPLIYTLARLVLGVILGGMMFYLIALLTKKTMIKFMSFIFVIFGSGFWLIKNKEIQLFMQTWTGFDPRERITFIPHHLLGDIAVVLSIILLTYYFKTQKNKYLLAACLTGFIGVFGNPITLLNGCMALVLMIPIYVLVNSDKILAFRKIIPAIFLYLGVCFLPFFYFNIVQNKTFPWTTYNPGLNMLMRSITLKEYILGLGPAFIFSLLGIKKLIEQKSFLSSFLLAWFVSPFIGIFIISKLFNVGNVYFLYAAHYIPAGIIAGFGLTNIISFVAAKVKLKWNIVFFPFFILLLLYFSVGWYGSLKKEMSFWTPNTYNIYLSNDFLSAFRFLNNNTPADSTIISGRLFGNVIPAFTHNRTFVGHIVNTYQFNQKESEMLAFFSQTDLANNQKLINKYHISYVFYSYDTDPVQQNFVKALGLKLIFQNPAVTIYQTSI